MEEYFEFMLWQEKLGWYAIGVLALVFVCIMIFMFVADTIQNIKKKIKARKDRKSNEKE